MEINYNELTIQELANLYSNYREELDILETTYKAKKKEIDDILRNIISPLQDKLHNEEPGPVKTATGGTVYLTKHAYVSKLSGEEGRQFLEFVKENNEWELLKSDPYSKKVQDYIEKTGVVPPGIKYEVFKEVTYKRNS